MNEKKCGADKNPSTEPKTNFSELQNECLVKGILFEDPEFPANESSLGVPNICSPIRWKRPVDIVGKPEFFSDNFDIFDVQPGEFGNKPLLCAMASLALRPNLFKLVVPENQSFHDRYAGIFHFKFWHYDRWVDVVIDDRLPTSSGRLIFLHSAGYREYWSALLEKAYAKLHGSYAGLKNSRATSVLTDLTGGVSEIYQLSSNPTRKYIEYLRDVLVDAHKKQSIIVCDADPWPTIFRDTSPSEAEVSSHDGCYCITKINTKVHDVTSPSLFLENPWRYGDGLTDAGCKHSDTCSDPGGQFFSDIKNTWVAVSNLFFFHAQIKICHLPEGEQWIKNTVHGEWLREVSAGGCRNMLETFPYNPQYGIEFKQPGKGKKTCKLLVSLAQKNHSVGKPVDCPYLPINLFIYRVEDRKRRLNIEFIYKTPSKARAQYTERREVTVGSELPPGKYCIIASTVYPDHEAKFMIRVWTESPHQLAEITGCSYVDPVSKVTLRRQIEYDFYNLTEIKRTFFKPAPQKGKKHQTKLQWADFMTVLNYTMNADPFFPSSTTPNGVFTKSFGDAMTKALVNAYPGTQLTLKKFVKLWTRIKFWRVTFTRCDPDNKGVLRGFKLRNAFEKVGYNVSNFEFEKIVRKHGASNGQVSFEDFTVYLLELYLGVH